MDEVLRPSLSTLDRTKPSPARVYDCLLGGRHHLAVDRELVARLVARLPQLPAITMANRQFLRRAVSMVASLGVDQFLDLGSGIPTAGNVHEVARRVRPDARVAYVDIDPDAVHQSRAILGDDPAAAVLRADLLDTRRVLSSPSVRGVIDFSHPVAVLMITTGHFIADTSALWRALMAYRRAVPPGSYLVLSHGTAEARPAEVADLISIYGESGTPLFARGRSELTRLLDGWQMIDPGLVYTTEWRPDDQAHADDPGGFSTLAVVARKA
jgi:SAM-dependent methyltransferase